MMRRDFSRAFGLLERHKLSFLATSLVRVALDSADTVLFSYSIKCMVDYFVYHDATLLPRVVAMVVAIVILGCFGVPYSIRLLSRCVETAMRDLRIRLFRFLQRLPISYFDRHHSGDVLSRINKDTEAYRKFLDNLDALMSCVVGIAMLTPYFMLLDLRFGAIAFVMGLISAVINARFIHPVRERSKEIHAKTALLAEAVTENVTGFSVVKLEGLQSLFLRRFREKVDWLFGEQLRYARMTAVLHSSNALLGWFNHGGLPVIGCLFVVGGSMEAGTLVAITAAAGSIAGRMGYIAQLLASAQASFAGVDRLHELLSEKPEPERYLTASKAPGNGIRMDEVRFGYAEDRPVLDGVTIHVPRGATAALVGDSGGGKSTIVKLLLGFHPAWEGEIGIEGRALRDYTLEELRDKIGYVPQDAYIFDGTIRENILIGDPDANQARITRAAEQADAHSFILAQPQGYDTHVGERGIRLSGGQRQRIAIARAILKDPPVLLLDEATSSLDSESELQVQRALSRLMEGRTSVVIAHRLSTVERASVIYVIEGGRVTDHGTHQELLSRGGTYRELYLRDFT